MAHLPMSEAVFQSEWGLPVIGVESGGLADAMTHLTSRMYTDAVFAQDIRVIQTIINRIDGGLPKDTEVGEYQTLFGDCMNEVLGLTHHLQLKVMPEDTVMMALCKSLYDIATTDIYHEIKSDKNGNKWARKINPSTERKQARDSALRLVLERAGGRKTSTPKKTGELVSVDVADWIKGALPQTGESDEAESQVDEAE